jgi:hypothetical protein
MSQNIGSVCPVGTLGAITDPNGNKMCINNMTQQITPNCPTGTTLQNGICNYPSSIIPTCAPSSTFNSTTGLCEFPPAIPVTCPSGANFDDSVKKCIYPIPTQPVCPNGSTNKNGLCVYPSPETPVCPSGTIWDNIGSCTYPGSIPPVCPSGTTLFGGMCQYPAAITPTCNGGIYQNGQCLASSCPTGYQLSPDSKTCITVISPICQIGTALSSDGTSCILVNNISSNNPSSTM